MIKLGDDICFVGGFEHCLRLECQIWFYVKATDVIKQVRQPTTALKQNNVVGA